MDWDARSGRWKKSAFMSLVVLLPILPPSLMTAIPARVAGVKDITDGYPTKKDGSIPSSTLVAADIAGVNTVYKIGGAQAIAALAYGTEYCA